MKANQSFGGHVVMAGPFDPAAIALFAPNSMVEGLASIRSDPGVPIHTLAEALLSRGIRTTLVGGVRGVRPCYFKSDSLSVSIYHRRGGLSFVLNGLNKERRAILDTLREIQPTVVHAHWTREAGRAVGDWDGPKLLTVHDAAWEYARLGANLRPFSLAFTARWLANTTATLKRLKHVIAVSPYVEAYLRIKHRFRGEIRVIPNALPTLPAGLRTPSRFPKTGMVTFACYGGPGTLKNVKVAIAAFRKLSKTLPDSRLLVFGGGWEKARAKAEYPQIEYKGSLPHRQFLQCLVEEVDVWVHPSRIEAHPLTICEAIQAGCPVIAGAGSGGVAWTLDYGRAGLLVDIESVDAVASAMRIAVLDRKGATELVTYGQNHIRKSFGTETVLDLHLQYYRDVMHDHGM